MAVHRLERKSIQLSFYFLVANLTGPGIANSEGTLPGSDYWMSGFGLARNIAACISGLENHL